MAIATPRPRSVSESKTQVSAYLLFAVWFKRPHGAQRYREYLAAASPIADKYGAKRVEGLLTVEALYGGFDPDYLFVTEWPDIEAYQRFLKDVQYHDAVAPMLSEATERTVVVHSRRV